MKKYFLVIVCILLCLCGCGKETKEAKNTPVTHLTLEATPPPNPPTKEVVKPKEPQLTFIGHSAVKIITKEGKVIYIDPSQKGDYSEVADYIFITHIQGDHSDTTKITYKPETQEFGSKDFLIDGKYQTKQLDGLKVTAVPAYNEIYDKAVCVGYILEFDGIKLYHAGDTDYIKEMKDLTKLHLDYAMFPIDGTYNMGPKEATKCANIVGAKHNLPMHTHFNTDFVLNMTLVNQFTPKGKLVVQNGDTISLTHK